MTIVADLLQRAAHAGVTLTVADGQIVAHGTGTVDAELLDHLRQQHDLLVAHLTGAYSDGMTAPDTITDPDGNTWKLQCRCGLHPHRSHLARPVTPEADT